MAIGNKRKSTRRLSVNPLYMPTGSVQEFAGGTAPDGFLMCDGAVVSRTTYAALFAVIGETYGAGDGSTTFKLPDLRGEFVRGADNMGTAQGSRGIDGGRTRGNNQSDATAVNGLTASTNETGSHQHFVHASDAPNNYPTNTTNALAGGIYSIGGFRYSLGNAEHSPSSISGAHSHSVSLLGNTETRPRNVAMNYIIKI